MKENVPGSIFHNAGLDSVIILSSLEFLNIATLWLYWDFKSVTGNNSLDVLLGFGFFFILNYFYFIQNERYKNIIEASKSKPKRIKFFVQYGTLVYVALTILFFYLIHSQQILA